MRLLLIFCCFVVVGSKGFTQSLRIETYGDSLTAGFLSETSLTNPPPMSELGQMMGEIAFGFIQKDRNIISKYEFPESSWPYFLTEELKNRGKQIEELHNLAVSGSKSAGVLEQIQKAGVVEKNTWAFLFVGHNDLCHVKGEVQVLIEHFRKNLEASLADWEKNHQGSILFLLPTSPIQQLYPVLNDYPWLETSKRSFKCQDAWNKYFPYCPSFYVRFKKGDLENYLKPRGEALSRELEKIAHEWTQKTERGNRYLFLEAQWPLPLRPEYFAMDCYHIAKPGQKIFADNITQALSNSFLIQEASH